MQGRENEQCRVGCGVGGNCGRVLKAKGWGRWGEGGVEATADGSENSESGQDGEGGEGLRGLGCCFHVSGACARLSTMVQGLLLAADLA